MLRCDGSPDGSPDGKMSPDTEFVPVVQVSRWLHDLFFHRVSPLATSSQDPQPAVATIVQPKRSIPPDFVPPHKRVSSLLFTYIVHNAHFHNLRLPNNLTSNQSQNLLTIRYQKILLSWMLLRNHRMVARLPLVSCLQTRFPPWPQLRRPSVRSSGNVIANSIQQFIRFRALHTRTGRTVNSGFIPSMTGTKLPAWYVPEKSFASVIAGKEYITRIQNHTAEIARLCS